MYKLIIVSAVLALAVAKPDIITPLSYTAPALAVHEPVIPVAHALPVAASVPVATPTLRYAAAAPVIATPALAAPLRIAAPAFTAPLTYPSPYSSPLAWSGYAAAPAPLPYAYDFGYDHPSYYWKKR